MSGFADSSLIQNATSSPNTAARHALNTPERRAANFQGNAGCQHQGVFGALLDQLSQHGRRLERALGVVEQNFGLLHVGSNEKHYSLLTTGELVVIGTQPG